MNRADRRTTTHNPVDKNFRIVNGVPTKIKRFSKKFEAEVNKLAKEFVEDKLSSPMQKLEFEEWILENFIIGMGCVDKETREPLDIFSEADFSLIDDDDFDFEILFKAFTERAISDFGSELVPFEYLIYRFFMG